MHATFFLFDSVILLAAVCCGSVIRFLVASLQGIAATIGTSNFFLALLMVSLYAPSRIDVSVFERCQALVFQSPILVFFFSELLLTRRTKFQATNNQIWLLLESLQATPGAAHFVNPIHESGNFRSTSTFQ